MLKESGPVQTWQQRCVFFLCRHVRTGTLMTMQSTSNDMVTTSKICVIVAKCERALIHYKCICNIMSENVGKRNFKQK